MEPSDIENLKEILVHDQYDGLPTMRSGLLPREINGKQYYIERWVDDIDGGMIYLAWPVSANHYKLFLSGSISDKDTRPDCMYLVSYDRNGDIKTHPIDRADIDQSYLGVELYASPEPVSMDKC